MNKTRFVTLALTASILFSSCLGSFSAFESLKDWNHQVSDNKFVNNLLFWGLNIIPVYGLFLVGDAVIFNVIEFWSGSNPIAMEEGEVEKEYFVKDGKSYEVIASQNKMVINLMDGDQIKETVELIYTPENKTWNAKMEDGEMIKLSSMEEGFYMVYLPNGEKVKMDPATSQKDGLAIINSKLLLMDKNHNYAMRF